MNPIFSIKSGTGSVVPKDIFSIINDFHSDKNLVSKEEIRQKMTDNSLKMSVAVLDYDKEEQKTNDQPIMEIGNSGPSIKA